MFNRELFCITMTLLCLSRFLTNTLCYFLLTSLPHRTWLKPRTAYKHTLAQRKLLRHAPCAKAGVFARYISYGNSASYTYIFPPWSLRLLLLMTLQLFMSFGLLNSSHPCFYIHSHLTPVLNPHSSHILSDITLPS